MEMSKKESSIVSPASFEEPDLHNVANFLIESLKERSGNNEENSMTKALIEGLTESKKGLNPLKRSKSHNGIKRKEMGKNNVLIKKIKEISNSIKKKEIKKVSVCKSVKGLFGIDFFFKKLSLSTFALIYVNKFTRTFKGYLKFSRKSKIVYYKNIYPKKKYKRILKKIRRKKVKDR